MTAPNLTPARSGGCWTIWRRSWPAWTPTRRRPRAELNILPADEREQVTSGWNQTAALIRLTSARLIAAIAAQAAVGHSSGSW
ncbi:MAG: hypothetical protein H6651_16560 [Ardenticatenales bacterium]|nr:hypothetical protein [Ardenticatenales bacterium]